MKKLKVFLLCLLMICMSCDKDDNQTNNDTNPDPDPSEFAENFGSETQRNFLGNVIDTNRNPIEGVIITIGTKTAQTDANGIFIINDATVNQRFGYVRAEKAGYLHGSRSVVPSSGTNKVTIMLLQENIVGTTNSGTAETIALPNGASVSLQGNYKKEDGTAYSGSVNVIMHHLDPSDEDKRNQMPGMLYGANVQNQERILQSFGILAVELKGSGGETLNLADGSSAEIKMPLNASLMANAPSTIPLWHFDETYGYWIEDGQATLVGNAYVGTVTHFSFWNCPIGFEPVYLCVITSDDQGNVIPYLSIVIQSENYGSGWGFSYMYGIDCGWVPKNEPLEIKIYNQTCGNAPIYNSNIGPFASDSNYNTTIPSNIEIISETISGTFTTCDGDPVTEGYVLLYDSYNLGENFFDFVDDGTFELSTLKCNTSPNVFRLKGVDYVNLQETDTLSFTYTTPVTNLGAIPACNSIEEFVTYQLDGGESITEYIGIESGSDTGINIFAGYIEIAGTDRLTISLSQNNPITVGTYTGGIGFSYQNNNIISDPNFIGTNITLNVSQFGAVGDYIDLNFTGTFMDVNSMQHSITATIHAKRDY